ncbi:MAG: DNA polymerase I [Planctomycetes bacterium]|nr:DNA polymerase I [Planctomycetota bacterium]
MTKHLYIIDGHHRIYKSYYAIAPGLTTPLGAPVNAVYGFVSTLNKLIKTRKPDYLLVAFDLPGKTFRNDIYEDYKATRKPPPEDLVEQFPIIQEVLRTLGIPQISMVNYEADDVMGAVAKQWGKEDLKVWIVTGDKDAKQLLSENIAIFDIDKNVEFGEKQLFEAWGIKPEQVIDYLAMVGDTSDNVPGIPKVGEKTALPVIQKYGTLENILESADKIADDDALKIRGKAGFAAKLRENTDIALLSKKLVTIKTDLDLPVKLDECKYAEPEPAKILNLFKELGFNTFIRDFQLLEKVNDQVETDYVCVNTDETFDRFKNALAKAIENQGYFAFDTETCNLETLNINLAENSDGNDGFFQSSKKKKEKLQKIDPINSEVIGYSVSFAPNTGYYVPLIAPAGEKLLDRNRILTHIKPILEDEKVGKIGHNLKFDILALRNLGIKLRGIKADTLVAAYLLNPGKSKLSLDYLAIELLGRNTIKITELIGEDKKNQITMAEVPLEKIAPYAAEDADISYQLYLKLRDKLEETGLTKLADDLEFPLVSVLSDIESRGMKLDTGFLEGFSNELKNMIETCKTAIHDEAGYEFNIRSTKELQTLLFEKREFPIIKKTPKSGPSTDEEVLSDLAVQFPEDKLLPLIIEYRELYKLKSTYSDALPKLVNRRTKKIHTSFNQCVTATGRLSSTDPNLQNIPVRTEMGRKIRGAFVPSSDELIFISADYSQVELRLLAHFSKDEVLVKAFNKDRDIHKIVASEIYGIDQGFVTPEMRSMGKTINFSVIYGKTPYGLSKQMHISFKEAKSFIDNYFERFSGVRQYFDDVLNSARENGFVTTILGRRRFLPELKIQNKQKSAQSEREAINTTIQGSAADLIKVAMIQVQKTIEMQKLDMHMVLQIHDELVFEVQKEKAQEYSQIIRKQMQDAMKLEIPLKVNVKIAENWAKLK